jgi:hypothetical protein
MATQPDFICATCDVTITHHPTFHLGLAFCCAGCAADGPCMCSYDVEDQPQQAAPAPALVARPRTALAMAPVARPAARAPLPERDPAPVPEAAPVLAAARR